MTTRDQGAFGGRAGGCLVIGGSGAIGRSVAVRLAELGGDVTVTYAGNSAAAEETALAVKEVGRDGVAVHLDLGDAFRVREVVGEAVARHGGLHTVVLAASPTNFQGWTSTIPPEQYLEQLRVDSGGTYTVISAALPSLRESRGSVVVVSTVANRRFVLRDVLSSGPKAANEAVVRAVAAEEGRYGVRANAVGVGILDEGMTQVLIDHGDIRPESLEVARGRIPLGTFGKARDIAATVGFLVSDEARYVTGQWIDVDGGYSL
ncbi:MULTISPECIES: SDR family NAD(P)-dependent oxidoreductase [Prauserella salsuginis group]|uniref:NAD(P)-dependent dehydrogenase (Short-subunit alcohol dehydrogenase family) n=2 Tax=Prauserella salsuginis group TaxID=2893672 RepID=A0A839XNV6_9PSEU|nr:MULTISPECIES: SDR family oxidoreductase [Prauserella salsuginis group]MBB3665522.1 NAD(P)-dependent dehydrogenase (short-subunit alcohol dehydrogenase family) [Prauserella sediminis]MCR3718780.1 NAD(P)-dependent dehydrogenase, short-chain alcohol dehydrogenase family [Prauserella flava]MCR3733350.1 NAD(P)-dependent dehydrogenase, short-chain alcohol dehydrogenase family [Prauserella salsuginis]